MDDRREEMRSSSSTALPAGATDIRMHLLQPPHSSDTVVGFANLDGVDGTDGRPLPLIDSDVDVDEKMPASVVMNRESNEAAVSLLSEGAAVPDAPVNSTITPDNPSSSDEHQPPSRRSTLRSLVRTLTPKRKTSRPVKPILVKAGVRRTQRDADNPEEPELRVTFDMAHAPLSATDSNVSQTARNIFGYFHKCCRSPVLPVAGTLSFLGGLSFGYDVGILSGVLPPVRDQFHLSCDQEEVMLGCFMAGALMVCICGGPWIDKCGRRRAILIASCFFVFGSGLSALSPNLDALAAGRLLQGFGLAMSAVAECIYVSEIAPKEKRGLLVGLNEIGITVGFLLVLVAGCALSGVKNAWRFIMGMSIVPALVQMIATFFILPPSPRERMMNKSDREAILILEHLRGSRNEAMNEFASIRHALVIEEGYGTLSLFRAKDNMLFRMLVGFSLVLLQQLAGQIHVLYYGSVMVGFTGSGAILASAGLCITKVVATVTALFLTDTRGRRFFLTLGCCIMCVSLIVLGVSCLVRPPVIQQVCQKTTLDALTFPNTHHQFLLDNPSHPEAQTQPSVGMSDFDETDWWTIGHRDPKRAAQIVVNYLAMVGFMTGFSIGFGSMLWLVLSEIYPAGIKGRAMSFANLLNWSACLTIWLTYLRTLKGLTPGGCFLALAVVNLFSALYVHLVVPDTKAKALERISYELRSKRPKQRYDENLQSLYFWRKKPAPPPASTSPRASLQATVPRTRLYARVSSPV